MRNKSIEKKVNNMTNHLREYSERLKTFLEKEQLKRAVAVERAMEALDTAQMREAFDELLENVELMKMNLGLMEQAEAEDVKPELPTYVVSSMFLWDCHEWLTRSEAEELCFITGVEMDGMLHLQHRSEFKLAMQSWGGAEADMASMTKALMEMDKYGHRLLAHFHSHPFKGADGTRPSSVDKDFQRRLETGKYAAIGAVFSRDGYVRFFANDIKFAVKVFGKGVEQVEEMVFRLVDSN